MRRFLHVTVSVVTLALSGASCSGLGAPGRVEPGDGGNGAAGGQGDTVLTNCAPAKNGIDLSPTRSGLLPGQMVEGQINFGCEYP